MTLTDIILLMIWTTMLLAIFKFMKAEITINYKQEFSDEDRKLLEDLYNNDGDPKEKYDVNEAFDNLVKTVNDIMLDSTEEA